MPSAGAISMIDVHISESLLFRQMLAEEGEHLAPAIHRLLGPVERPVPIEEAVAGAIVAVELVHLAVLLELSLVLVHLLGARRAVVIAEQAEQRTAQVLCHVDWRDRRLGIEFLLAHHHATAPKLGAGVDVLALTGIDEGVTATRTGTEKADLAVMVGLRAHPLYGGFGIANHLGVGDDAFGADLGGDVVRIALACTLIEVGADRKIAVMGEASRRLNVEFAPAREMMDKHHAWKRPGTSGLGD